MVPQRGILRVVSVPSLLPARFYSGAWVPHEGRARLVPSAKAGSPPASSPARERPGNQAEKQCLVGLDGLFLDKAEERDRFPPRATHCCAGLKREFRGGLAEGP